MTSVRARAWDALVLVLVVGTLFEVLTTNQDVPLELSVPVALLMTVPLIWGQRRPLLVTAVVLGAWLVQEFAGTWQQQPQSELLPVCVAFWCLGAYAADRVAPWAFGTAFVALVVHQPDDAIVLGPLMAGVFAAGRLMRSRERLAQALQEERAQAERYAVAEERARIARELHDVVGHSIALMTVQAGAERLALGDARPETSRVLSQIEVTGRQTLQEMRRLLGILREPDDVVDLTPQPGLDQVDALADRMRRAGLTVDVQVEGEARSLSPGVDISAYRIVQEGLTNVLKHAESSQARVRIAHVEGVVEIEVTDRGAGHAVPPNGHGHGLTGMRERVALYGGSLEVGPAPGRWLASGGEAAEGARAVTVRVLVADDQALIREGLRKIFEADPDLEVVADVGDGLAAVFESRRLRPDVVVMDIRMPNLDGIEATRQVTALQDPPRILVLTTFDLDEYVFGALRAGASGFLLKDAMPEHLIEAVHTIARGDSLLDPAVTRVVVERFGRTPKADSAATKRLAGLSQREREVMMLLVAGSSNKEIAAQLFVSEATVKTHVMAVLRKLGLRDRIQAVIFGYESGLVTPGER